MWLSCSSVTLADSLIRILPWNILQTVIVSPESGWFERARRKQTFQRDLISTTVGGQLPQGRQHVLSSEAKLKSVS